MVDYVGVRNVVVILTAIVLLLSTTPASTEDRTEGPSARWCQYRDVPLRYPADVFSLHASYNCYNYSRDGWFLPGMRYPAVVRQINGFQYLGIRVNGTSMDVDHTKPEVVEVISKSFSLPRYVTKWIDCSETAVKCCDFMLTLTDQDQPQGCPAVWDGWHCFAPAPNYSVQHEVCPAFAYTSSAPSCDHYTSKDCNAGVWNVQTDTSTCDIRTRLRTRQLYHVIVMAISVIVSLPAIVIFFTYRKLRESTRVVLNRNLLIAIVARNILSITSKTAIVLEALYTEEKMTVMEQNGLPCKILAVCEKLASNSVFVCMLLLGIFLHRLIAAAFRGEPNMSWFYVVGAAVNCLPVIVWSAVMVVFNDNNCWIVDDNSYHWINDAPRIIMLVVNLLLIADIIRVLITKLRSVKTGNSNHIKRTIKATVFLTPVFGVQYIFTAARPTTTDCTGEQVYYFISYGLDGFQGAVVSLLFCYLNQEVQSLLRRSLCRSRNNQNALKTTITTLVEPNNKNISDPPTPILDTRCIPQRPTTLDLPRGGSILRKTPTKYPLEENSFDNFYTPKNSVAGSPPESAFYTPRSSMTGSGIGNFYDCIDDQPIVMYQTDGDHGRDGENKGFTMEVSDEKSAGRERASSVYFDI